jgi:hypothetical protein
MPDIFDEVHADHVKAKNPTHAAGRVTGYEEKSGLPIVKLAPRPSDAEEPEETRVPRGTKGEGEPEPKTEKPEPKPEKDETEQPEPETAKKPEPEAEPEVQPEVQAKVQAKVQDKVKAPEKESAPKPSGLKVGDRVTLPSGKPATVAYVPSKGAQLPTYRFKDDAGKTLELRASQVDGKVKPAADRKPEDQVAVAAHFRKLPSR